MGVRSEIGWGHEPGSFRPCRPSNSWWYPSVPEATTSWAVILSLLGGVRDRVPRYLRSPVLYQSWSVSAGIGASPAGILRRQERDLRYQRNDWAHHDGR